MFLNRSISNISTEVFRLNNRLLMTCDVLLADLGLSSARLQVLGVMASALIPQPVAQIARELGLSRQAVQRLANELERNGVVRFGVNPRHQQAKLVLFTANGRMRYGFAVQRLEPLAAKLGLDLTVSQVKAATAVLRAIRHRIERGDVRDRMRGTGRRIRETNAKDPPKI